MPQQEAKKQTTAFAFADLMRLVLALLATAAAAVRPASGQMPHRLASGGPPEPRHFHRYGTAIFPSSPPGATANQAGTISLTQQIKIGKFSVKNQAKKNRDA
jgi:hypothetical protein